MELDIVTLSRLQFALTAMYHFLFVPLTLGLSLLLAHHGERLRHDRPQIWRQMTKFWGMLFGINFAHGCRHRHHHGIPVRHELELLQPLRRRHLRRAAGHRGPDGLLPRGDLRRPVLLRLGQALSKAGISSSPGWWPRLEPLGAVDPDRQRLDAASGRAPPSIPQTMRMEVTDFYAVLFNPVAQAKFVHTVSRRLRHGLGLRARRSVPGICCGAGMSSSPSAR